MLPVYVQIMWTMKKWTVNKPRSEGCCQRKLNNAHLIDMWVVCTYESGNINRHEWYHNEILSLFTGSFEFCWRVFVWVHMSSLYIWERKHWSSWMLSQWDSFPFYRFNLNSVEGFWWDKLELGRALKFEIRLVCQTAQLSMQIQLFKINTIQLHC